MISFSPFCRSLRYPSARVLAPLHNSGYIILAPQSSKILVTGTPTSNQALKYSPHVIAHQYTSRAHPTLTPTYSVTEAIGLILEGTASRIEKRQLRWDRNVEKRAKARAAGSTLFGPDPEEPYRNQNETIELAVNLNLDPRKPNQNLRGSIALPHGTGKHTRLAVFCKTEEQAASAIEAGADVAGVDLVERVKSGDISPDDFDRTLATQDVMPQLTRSLARLLGPRGLMPTPKLGTVVLPNEDLVSKVKAQLVGLVNYRTEKSGIVHAPIGKASFGDSKIADNFMVFMKHLSEIRPELDKKKGKHGKKIKGGASKYILKVHLTATQGKSVRLDLASADPTSLFFMKQRMV